MGEKSNKVVSWYKADKGKKFYKRRWFFTVVILAVGIAWAGPQEDTPTNTPTVVTKPVAVTKVAPKPIVKDNRINTDILYYTQIKTKDLLASRLVKTELTDGSLIIHFKLNDNFNMKNVGDGAFMDASNIFALYKGKTGYKDISCIGSYPMQDKYGKQSDSNIFAITLDKATIQKITYENINPITDLLPLASSHMVRHELTD